MCLGLRLRKRGQFYLPAPIGFPKTSSSLYAYLISQEYSHLRSLQNVWGPEPMKTRAHCSKLFKNFPTLLHQAWDPLSAGSCVIAEIPHLRKIKHIPTLITKQNGPLQGKMRVWRDRIISFQLKRIHCRYCVEAYKTANFFSPTNTAMLYDSP